MAARQWTRAQRRAQLLAIIGYDHTTDAAEAAAIDALVTAAGLAAVTGTTFAVDLVNRRGVTNAAITSGLKVLTSASNPFLATDVGKKVYIQGAGAAAATLATTIVKYTSAGSVTVEDAASTTVAPSATSTGGLAIWGNAVGDTETDSTNLMPNAVKSATDVAAQHWRADVRDALTSFPVPCIRPEKLDTVIALDVCPNGAPTDFSNNGVAWVDICDTDVLNGDPALVALRLGISTTDMEIGIRSFNGATKKPLRVKNDTVTVLEFAIDGPITSGFSNNGVSKLTQSNPNAGASAYAELDVVADNTAKALRLRKYSAAFNADSNNYLDRAEIIADGCDLMIGGSVVYFHSGYPFSTKRSGAYDANGNWTLGRTPSFASYHSIGRGTNEGDQLLLLESLASYYRVGNFSYNAAAAGVKIGRNTSTSRSINAAGTVNASGADYAEYMRKDEACGAIAKGAVCGVNADGELVDRFNAAHSFVVKSTDPSLVGGDAWGVALGERPNQEDDAAGAAAWDERYNAERQHWDRIAFSGRVPCNVTGPVAVGDYIIADATPDGGIAAVAIPSPSFEQYRMAVGKVWAIGADGRPIIAVKVG